MMTKPGVTWQVRTVKMTRENEAFDKAFPVILARDKVVERAKEFDEAWVADINGEMLATVSRLRSAIHDLLAAEKDRT
jgi:hypothetical protein